MELWDQVEAIDEPVAADWARLVINRWHHDGETGGVIYIMSSAVAARQFSKSEWASAQRGSSVRGRGHDSSLMNLWEWLCI